jgi:hypothetical protein
LIGAVFRGLDTRRAAPSRRERPPAAGGWLRPASYAVVGVWLVVGVTSGVLMGCLAFAGEKVYRDLASLLPDPPRDARIYVVSQNPLNSVGFTQALRLRYGRSDLAGCALSLSPTLCASSTDRILPLGPDSIRLVREGGAFFSSFFERFHRFSEPASGLAETARRSGLELLNPPPSLDDLRVLELRLPYPLDDPRIQVFYWDNHRIRHWWDLIRMGNVTELSRCRPTCPRRCP